LTPGLVKRVHKLYEELGREDIQAVQDWRRRSGRLGKMNPINKQTQTINEFIEILKYKD